MAPAPQSGNAVPAVMDRALLRRCGGGLFRRLRALSAADGRSGRPAGLVVAAEVAGDRFRLATGALAGPGRRELPALGRLPPVRGELASARPRPVVQSPSHLGGRRPGPPPLYGSTGSPAASQNATSAARRPHRLQRTGPC